MAVHTFLICRLRAVRRARTFFNPIPRNCGSRRNPKGGAPAPPPSAERAFKSRNILAGTRFLSLQFEGLRSGKSPPPNAVSDVRRANCPAAIGKAAAPAKNACPRTENFRLQIAGEISILVFLIMIPDVLAERYASKAMRQIWSAEGKILLERDLW